MKAQLLVVENIRALLRARGTNAKALALYAGHKPSWASKILHGKRSVHCEDLDKIADFFGLQACDLLSYGITPVLERRKAERRSGVVDRRQGERRALERRNPELRNPWRKKMR